MTNDCSETVARDRRVALHEAAHLTVGRVLGAEFGGATIDENVDLGFSGLCWGPDFQFCLAGEAAEAKSTIKQQIADLMPRDGDGREDAADVFRHVVTQVTELTAGSEAEIAAYGYAWSASDDRKQEQQLASLIYSTPDAAAAFVAACALEARSILQRHADVLEALTNALLAHRTLDAAQIDDTISRAVAARQLAHEQERRERWQGTLASAASFGIEKQS